MKQPIPILLFICILPALIIISCGPTNTFSITDKEIFDITARGNLIVDALSKFYKANRTYPEKIEELLPDYLTTLPKTGFEVEGNEYSSFNYRKSKFDTAADDKYRYGFQLRVFINNWTVLGNRSSKSLTYRPSQLYPERKWEKPIKRIGDWAIIESYRRYGDKENPITGKGV